MKKEDKFISTKYKFLDIQTMRNESNLIKNDSKQYKLSAIWLIGGGAVLTYLGGGGILTDIGSIITTGGIISYVVWLIKSGKVVIKLNFLLIVSSLALIAALLPWPYSYYIFLRWLTSITALALTIKAFKGGNKLYASLGVVVTIIFNPILPIHSTRAIWSIVDLAVAVLFLSSTRRKYSLPNQNDL